MLKKNKKKENSDTLAVHLLYDYTWSEQSEREFGPLFPFTEVQLSLKALEVKPERQRAN